MKNKNFEIGARIYHVKDPDSIGTVVGPVFASDVDGGPRQLVFWDLSGMYTSHDPIFYFEKDTPYEQVPNVIHSGRLAFLKKTGLWLVKKDKKNDSDNKSL